MVNKFYYSNYNTTKIFDHPVAFHSGTMYNAQLYNGIIVPLRKSTGSSKIFCCVIIGIIKFVDHDIIEFLSCFSYIYICMHSIERKHHTRHNTKYNNNPVHGG